MAPRGFCFLVLGLGPIALTACVEPAPAAADVTSLAPNIGIDLGSSARVRHVAGLAGEGEGFGRTEPGATPAAHGSMPGMSHGSMGGMEMDHGAMPSTGHGSTGGMRMDHGSMPGMSHDAPGGMQMNHGSRQAPHGSMASMQMDHGSMPGMRHRSTGGVHIADAGHSHAQGTGTVNSIDTAGLKINVTHAPIPAIGFPAMTMDFGVAPKVDLQAVKPGTRVNFTVEHGEGGMYVIQSITPAGGGR